MTEYYKDYRKVGLCGWCRSPAVKSLCEPCLIKNRIVSLERQKRLGNTTQKKRKALGLCTRCGGSRPCSKCSRKVYESQKRAKAKLRGDSK